MQGDEISIHEVRVYLTLKTTANWMTNEEVATAAKVKPRTARAHTQRLVKLGILEQMQLFPARKYRLATGDRCDLAYIQRLEEARSAFGLCDASSG